MVEANYMKVVSSGNSVPDNITDIQAHCGKHGTYVREWDGPAWPTIWPSRTPAIRLPAVGEYCPFCGAKKEQATAYRCACCQSKYSAASKIVEELT